MQNTQILHSSNLLNFLNFYPAEISCWILGPMSLFAQYISFDTCVNEFSFNLLIRFRYKIEVETKPKAIEYLFNLSKALSKSARLNLFTKSKYKSNGTIVQELFSTNNSKVQIKTQNRLFWSLPIDGSNSIAVEIENGTNDSTNQNDK